MGSKEVKDLFEEEEDEEEEAEEEEEREKGAMEGTRLRNSSSGEDVMEENSDGKTWSGRISLRSHLDTVTSFSFHHEELALVSGSDDGMVKLWSLDGLTPRPQRT